MPITIVCSKCQKQHKVPDSLAGRACRCKCGNVIRVPAAVAAPVASGSLFDEVSAADVDRFKNVPKPAAAEPGEPNPYQGSAAAHYLARAASTRVQATSRPVWVTVTQVALGISGGLSLLTAAFIVLMIAMHPVAPDEATRSFRPVIITLGVYHAALGFLGLLAIGKLQTRGDGARIVAFVAAGGSILASPIHIFCGVMAIVGLVQPRTAEYLRN